MKMVSAADAKEVGEEIPMKKRAATETNLFIGKFPQNLRPFPNNAV